jgi:hypothetical protein
MSWLLTTFSKLPQHYALVLIWGLATLALAPSLRSPWLTGKISRTLLRMGTMDG